MIGFICIKVSSAFISPIFYNLLYWLANIITLLLLLLYTFHFVEKYDQWPWYKLEFFYCCVVVLAYIGTSIFAATLAESVGYAVGVNISQSLLIWCTLKIYPCSFSCSTLKYLNKFVSDGSLTLKH